jgi:hypothetical protein
MACERVQLSKKTHGDGAGIVRKLDANRKRIPATCASSGQSKRFLAALVLAHAPVQKNCMTLHDAEARPNLHFLSSPATLGESQKSLVFPRILPMKTGLWLGAESNRRHVDFQSTALPTELPSLLPMKIDTNDLSPVTVIDGMLTFSTASANICDHETANP